MVGQWAGWRQGCDAFSVNAYVHMYAPLHLFQQLIVWVFLAVCKNVTPLLSMCTLVEQVQWSGRQLREAAAELQESSQAEAQRRAAQHSHLVLILPCHVFLILTQGK